MPGLAAAVAKALVMLGVRAVVDTAEGPPAQQARQGLRVLGRGHGHRGVPARVLRRPRHLNAQASRGPKAFGGEVVYHCRHGFTKIGEADAA